ncbi:MAG: penicillin-binding protein 1A [Robiginitomaculum sp.]
MNTETISPSTPVPTKAPKQKKPGKKRWGFWRIVKWLFWTGFITGVLAILFAGIIVIRATRDLPSIDSLGEYSPSVMSRVHAGDGKLIAEYGIEKRVFVPISSIPKGIQYALVASEDQRFYQHDGFDPRGFVRAMVANVKHVIKKERMEGGSTLTQQVAKHFLVGNEREIDRKIREIFIAKRIEKAMSKDKILELYLNDMYFGRRAYGIAGASLNYFNKPLDNLTLGQMAYLAGLVKGPNNYQPSKNMEKAINRRNYVLGRMVEDDYITQEQAAKAKTEKLVIADRLFGEEYLAAEYFVAEVRKQINELYGEKELNEGGLSIRTTLDTKMQLAARKALRRGLGMYDRRHGYRGPLATIDVDGDWRETLAEVEMPKDVAPWVMAVVLKAKGKTAEIGFVDGENGNLSLSDFDWARKELDNGKIGPKLKVVTDAINAGDVILVEVKPNSKTGNEYNLRQVPEVNGGIIAMDPHTGRVLALVGGYSFKQSQFNRVTQAYRQPGSAFKPFVYAAALDNGFTPVSKILDAPFVIEHNDRDNRCKEQEGKGLIALRMGAANESGKAEKVPQSVPTEITDQENLDNEDKKECGPIFYKPANFNAGKFYGLSTLRLGLEKSRNAMTVRLANDIGMTVIGQYGRNFGIYDETKPELAWALGAGETTLMRMAAAYSTIVNSGKKVIPTLLDRVQDGSGKTVYLNDARKCFECAQDEWNGSSPPVLPDEREVVLSPVTAYQVTSLLEGVVQRGTGRQMKVLERPIAGKTGTTNDFKDAWFMGFSPDLVAGVYVGYDTPKSLGTETGAKAAGPIFRYFMGDVLKGKPKVAFRIPDGVLLVPVNKVTGEPSYIGAPDFIYEAFKPGTEPRIGGSHSKINVGSGGSYTNYDFDSDNVTAENYGDVFIEEIDEATREATKDDFPKSKTNAEKKGVKSISKDSGTPFSKGVGTLKPPKKPIKEPSEDDVDLDDGLY